MGLVELLISWRDLRFLCLAITFLEFTLVNIIDLVDCLLACLTVAWSAKARVVPIFVAGEWVSVFRCVFVFVMTIKDESRAFWWMLQTC